MANEVVQGYPPRGTRITWKYPTDVVDITYWGWVEDLDFDTGDITAILECVIVGSVKVLRNKQTTKTYCAGQGSFTDSWARVILKVENIT